ncbi:MAG: TrmH family RNA methyltransferase [Candidatus Saccharimonadales bacterium]
MSEIIVIAHNIRSTHNVGAIFRSSEGFGVSKIILSGYTPYPTLPDDTRLPHISRKLTDQIHKTALGAETMVEFDYYPDIRTWLCENDENLRLPVIALEQTSASVMLPEFTPPVKFALLLGEEVNGIEDDLLAWCDHVVEIPMVGKKESFNVSVAAGIALYALTVTVR